MGMCGVNAKYCNSVMEPLALAAALEKFEPVVVFKPVPFRSLPPCEGCPDHEACVPLDTVAVITYRYWIESKQIHSHVYEMRVCGSCLAWELHLLTRPDAPRVTEILTVEVLMIDNEGGH
ncbi:MAG: hypothetical protein JWO67_4507 [Streptosporangiaceae bacterium]|nr:hypothetical protein [Streptosporangiaceae bacterium]